MGKDGKKQQRKAQSGTRNASSANGRGSPEFVRFITLRNGKVLDAHDYGYKAWPIGRRS